MPSTLPPPTIDIAPIHPPAKDRQAMEDEAEDEEEGDHGKTVPLPASLTSARDSLTSMLTTSSSSGTSVYLASPTSPTFPEPPVVRVQGQDADLDALDPDAADENEDRWDVRTPRAASEAVDMEKTPLASGAAQLRGHCHPGLRDAHLGNVERDADHDREVVQPWISTAPAFTSTTAGLFDKQDLDNAIAPAAALDDSPTLGPTSTFALDSHLPFLSLRSRDPGMLHTKAIPEQLHNDATMSSGVPVFRSSPEQLDEVHPWSDGSSTKISTVSLDPTTPPTTFEHLTARSVSLTSLSSVSSAGSFENTSPRLSSSVLRPDGSPKSMQVSRGSNVFRSRVPLSTSSTPELSARNTPPTIPGPLTRSTSSNGVGTTPTSNPAVLGRRAIRAHYRRSTASSNISILDTVPESPRDMDLSPDGSWALRPRCTSSLHRSVSQPALRGHLRLIGVGTEPKPRLQRTGSFHSTDRKEAESLAAASSAKRNIQQMLSQRARRRAVEQKAIPAIWRMTPSKEVSPDTSQLVAHALGLPHDMSFIPTRRAPKPPGAPLRSLPPPVPSKDGDGKEALNAMREAEEWSWPETPTLGSFCVRVARSPSDESAQDDGLASFGPEVAVGGNEKKPTGTFGKWRRAFRSTYV